MDIATDTLGCISHRQHVTYFVMFEDYRDVARETSGTEHEHKLAAFWRVLESKTNDRIKYNKQRKQDGLSDIGMWIEIAYSEFVEWSQDIYKTSSFQIASAESERLGFSKSRVVQKPRDRQDPFSPKEDCKEYWFDVEAMQKALSEKEYPTPVETNSPLLKSIAARKEKKEQEKQERLLKSIAPPVENNTPPVEINNKKYSSNIYPKIEEEEQSMPAEVSTSEETSSTSSFVVEQDQDEPLVQQAREIADILRLPFGVSLLNTVKQFSLHPGLHLTLIAEEARAYIDSPKNTRKTEMSVLFFHDTLERNLKRHQRKVASLPPVHTATDGKIVVPPLLSGGTNGRTLRQEEEQRRQRILAQGNTRYSPQHHPHV